MSQVYYPSCVVNIRLKFDESLHVYDPGADPQTNDQALKSPPTPSGPSSQPLILKPGDENASFIMARIPSHCSVELPGYRQAAQFSMSIPFRDLPLDPRAVRAAAVEIHMGAVAADEFAAGMRGQSGSGGLRSVLQTRDPATGQIRSDTLLMVGMVDEWSVNHDDGGSTISMSGRDLRGVLLDTPIATSPKSGGSDDEGASEGESPAPDGEPPPGILYELDWAEPIDVLVANILNFNPLFQQFQVVCVEEEWPDGKIPSPGAEGIVPRHRKGAKGKKSASAQQSAGSDNMSYWDLIVKACYLCGAIPYFQGSNLMIRPSRSIYDQAKAGDPLNPTPFAGGRRRTRDAQTRSSIDPPLAYRRLVYGRDVKSISFDRRYGGFQRPRVVRAVGIDSSAFTKNRGPKRIIEGKWPDASAPARAHRTRVAPGGDGEADATEVLNIPVPGVESEERLKEIARSIYEEIGRGELGGSVETTNLASFGGDNADPDLMSLKPGDAVEFLVDARAARSAPPLVAALTEFQRGGFEEAVQALAKRIGDQNLARVIVATSRGQVAELQRFFRVSTVKYDWTAAGIKLAFDYQNYVMVPSFPPTSESDGQLKVTTAGRKP